MILCLVAVYRKVQNHRLVHTPTFYDRCLAQPISQQQQSCFNNKNHNTMIQISFHARSPISQQKKTYNINLMYRNFSSIFQIHIQTVGKPFFLNMFLFYTMTYMYTRIPHTQRKVQKSSKHHHCKTMNNFFLIT